MFAHPALPELCARAVYVKTPCDARKETFKEFPSGLIVFAATAVSLHF